MALYDVATGFLWEAPSAESSAHEAMKALTDFVGPRENARSFYSDNVTELSKAAKVLGWQHPTSTPYVSHTNGVVERQVRTAEEGARTQARRVRHRAAAL